jgi:tetratricopeptide (TPR) repeat protein
MKLTIDEIILWPEDRSNDIRVINFEADKINIIHGVSGTGKSSIISIIDYCLGSSKCQIPVGLIRDMVLWFGLKVTFHGEKWLIARKTPGIKNVSNDFVCQLFTGELPNELLPSYNQSQFKEKLNALVRMSNLPHSDDDKPSRLDSRSSYRDMAAFNFLPQHIVANPNTLFFKADAWEHKERLKRALPYALGIVDAQYVINERRREDLIKEQEGLKKQLAIIDKALNNWQFDIDRLGFMGVEIGVFEHRTGLSFEEKIARLQSVVDRHTQGTLEETLRAPNYEFRNKAFENALLAEEAQQDIVDELRTAISSYEALSHSGQKFSAAVASEKAHVVNFDWLKNSVELDGHCVACGSETSTLTSIMTNLENKVQKIRRLSEVLQENPVVDKEIGALKKNLSQEQKKLHQLRTEKNKILAEDEKLRNAISKLYIYVGAIASKLEQIGKMSADQQLLDRIKELGREIRDYTVLMEKTDRKSQEIKVDQALGLLIEKYADLFGLDRKTSVVLDRKELTLRFPNGDRSEYLWEVGSGANWMGYHIATFVAIHEYLALEENRHLPPFSFIVIDQPSQVYFPSSNAGVNALDAVEEKRAELEQERAQDIVATQKIFEVLSKGIQNAGLNVQIIVLEHADEDIWSGTKHINPVEAWKTKGVGLIPKSWLANRTTL